MKLMDLLKTKDEVFNQFLSSMDSCQEVVLGDSPYKYHFAPHPVMENYFLLCTRRHELVLNEQNFSSLCKLTGIPTSYTSRVPKELLFPHLSYWLSQEGGMRVKILLKPGQVCDSDGRLIILSVGDVSAVYIPPSRVFSWLDSVLGDSYQIEGFIDKDVSWNSVSFGVVHPDYKFELEGVSPEVGDILYGGLKLKYSVFGKLRFIVATFLLTLVCLNGMISANELYRAKQLSSIEDLEQWFLASAEEGIAALSKEVERVHELTKIKISPEEIAPYLIALFERYKISKSLREFILSKAMVRSPSTLYELMNIVTEVAHETEKQKDVFALQSLGGQVVENSYRCSTCHRPFYAF